MASSDKIKVVLLASKWSSKHGGLSTLNRELAIKLAEHSDVQVSVFLPKCGDKEEKEARDKKITLVQAERIAGSKDKIQWLCFPPRELEIDFVIGHGVVLGYPAQMIRKSHPCKWVQFVHTDPEELGMYSDAVSKGEVKRQTEVELCTMADFVVAVGPKLAEAYRGYLRFCGKDQNVFNLTPGIFSEFANVLQSQQEGDKFRVLSFGRGDAEDFYLKGFDIAAKAVGKVNDALLIFVGAEPKKKDDAAARLKECNLPATQLRVRAYIESRDHLMQLFSEVDLAIMPSRTEGFGLAALEALSAGLPVLVSGNSGFGEALHKKVSFGSTYVIQSEEVEAWAEAIDNVKKKPRGIRLEESKLLLNNYAKRYNWAEQITDLVEKMKDLLNGKDPSLPIVLSHLVRTAGGGTPSVANSYNTLAVTERDRCNFPAALTYGQHALSIRLQLYGEDHPSTAESYHALGDTQRAMGDYTSALESAKHALRIRKKLFGEEHLSTADIYHSAGDTQRAIGDYPSALEYGKCALAIRLKLLGEEHLSTADICHSIGDTQRALGNYPSALEYGKRALAIRLKLLGEEHLSTADIYHSIGDTQRALGDYTSALDYAKHALDIRLKILGEDHASTADIYHSLGDTQRALGDLSSARQSHERALRIREKLFGKEHVNTADR